MTEARPLFVREATGLVREIGFLLGVLLIMANVVGLGWQKRAFQFTGPAPIPNNEMWLGLPPIIWAFMLGGLGILITGYAVGLVTSAMPRSGGGYVTISRILHPFVGYMAAWLEYLAIAFSYGLIGTAIFEAIMIFYNIAGIPISFDSTQLFVGGATVALAFTVFALFGVRLYGRILQTVFWVPAAITAAFFAMWILAASDPSVLSAGVESVMKAPPEKFVDLALQQGMATQFGGSFMDAVNVAMVGVFWAYIGWFAATFVAGEVKEAHIRLPKIIVTAGIIIVVLYVTASTASALAAMKTAVTVVDGREWSFFQAYSYLSYGGVERGLVKSVIPNFQGAWTTGLASLTAQGAGLGLLSWLIALGGVLWLANDVPPFLLTSSRVLFAMGFDRMMPERFGYVSERWHSPTYALVFTGLLSLFGAASEAAESGAGGLFSRALSGKLLWAGVLGTDIFDGLFLLFFSLSALALPLRRRDVFEKAAVRLHPLLYVLVGMGATAAAIWWEWTFINVGYVDFFLHPINAPAFAAMVALGASLYISYWLRNRRRGIDVGTLYLSIPPE